ncbi:hypothetical protein [Lacinutrix salivirga]
MELVGDKNQLTIVFDKALKGKKVQIEPFRGKPDINNAKDYVRTTTIKEPATPKITIRVKAHLYLKTQCDSIENAGETIENTFLKGGGFKLDAKLFWTVPIKMEKLRFTIFMQFTTENLQQPMLVNIKI